MATIMPGSNERYFPAHPSNEKPYISHGLPFHEACKLHAEDTFKASKIYVVVSNSISKTSAFADLQNALESKIIGVRRGIAPHTPWTEVFELARDIKAKGADLIITLGGGSLTDGVKLARLFVANDVSDLSGVEEISEKCKTGADAPSEEQVRSATIPCINVPTTLSGGEFTQVGGATDTEGDGQKQVVHHKSMLADLVIFDPALTVSTPKRFWLSTGIRGVDHYVEGLYANMPDAKPEISRDLLEALRALLANLLKTNNDWEDLDARLGAMLAVKECPRAISNGIGASHGIGHQLGPLGVEHGETSCVMLPWVMKYNWKHGGEQVHKPLQRIADLFWDEPTVVETLKAQGLEKDDADPGDLVAAFVSALGQPRNLSHFNIGEDKFGKLADNAMKDWCTQSNPVKLDKDKVVEILKMAA